MFFKKTEDKNDDIMYRSKWIGQEISRKTEGQKNYICDTTCRNMYVKTHEGVNTNRTILFEAHQLHNPVYLKKNIKQLI